VPAGPGRWRAVKRIDRIDVERLALWHVPSGPLPLVPATCGEPALIHDPWRGWTEQRAGFDAFCPYFGPGHPGVIWLHYNPHGPGTRHGVGISQFEWIGDYFSLIDNPASPATEQFWKDLRRWLVRRTMGRASRSDGRAFPSAMAKILASGELR
jgi:hypothetical protein